MINKTNIIYRPYRKTYLFILFKIGPATFGKTVYKNKGNKDGRTKKNKFKKSNSALPISPSINDPLTSLAAVKLKKTASKLVALIIIPIPNHLKICLPLSILEVLNFFSLISKVFKAKNIKNIPITKSTTEEAVVGFMPAGASWPKAEPKIIIITPTRKVPARRAAVRALGCHLLPKRTIAKASIPGLKVEARFKGMTAVNKLSIILGGFVSSQPSRKRAKPAFVPLLAGLRRGKGGGYRSRTC